MPSHLHYVEPYAGSLAVLLAKRPDGVSEAVNDLNDELTNFWRVLQNPSEFGRFLRLCDATPCSRVEFRKAKSQGHDLSDDPARAAWQFFIVNRQSRQALGKDFATIARNRTRRRSP